MIRARGGGGLLRFGRCAPYAAQPAPTPRIQYPGGLFYWSQTGDISNGARQPGCRVCRVCVGCVQDFLAGAVCRAICA